MVIIDQKRNHVITSKNCLGLFNRNPDELLGRFITVDVTWIYHNRPKKTAQSLAFYERIGAEEGQVGSVN